MGKVEFELPDELAVKIRAQAEKGKRTVGDYLAIRINADGWMKRSWWDTWCKANMIFREASIGFLLFALLSLFAWFIHTLQGKLTAQQIELFDGVHYWTNLSYLAVFGVRGIYRV